MADSKQAVRASLYRLSTVIDRFYTYLLPLECMVCRLLRIAF